MSKTPIPVWMKEEVLVRDGWACLSCDTPVRLYPGGMKKPDCLEFDHIIPEARRGMTTVDNLQVLCRRCHGKKGTKTVDYRKPLTESPTVFDLSLDQEVEMELDILRRTSEPYDIEPELAALRAQAPAVRANLPAWRAKARQVCQDRYMECWGEVYLSAPSVIQDKWDDEVYPGWEMDAFPGDPRRQALARSLA